MANVIALSSDGSVRVSESALSSTLSGMGEPAYTHTGTSSHRDIGAHTRTHTRALRDLGSHTRHSRTLKPEIIRVFYSRFSMRLSQIEKQHRIWRGS